MSGSKEKTKIIAPEVNPNFHVKKVGDLDDRMSLFQNAGDIEVEMIDNRILGFQNKNARKDTFGGRLKHYIKSAVNRSSWLSTEIVPTQDELDREMEDATTTFKMTSLSSSQKTKRGKKFKEKAEQQANMINLMNQCNWKRDEAVNSLLNKESDTFLNNVSEDTDEISLQIKDLSFYYEQKGQEDGNTLELIADPTTKIAGYKSVIEEFERLDLSQFEYKDNKSFMKNEEDGSFVKRYATLKAFSHAREMIDSIGRSELGEKRYFELRVKASVIRDIMDDYENRAILLQSPYYALLAGKDFDALSKEDLESRINRTEDPLVKLYLERILERRKITSFGKGVKVKDALAKKKKELPEEIKKEDTENLIFINDEYKTTVNLEHIRDEVFTRRDKEARTGLQVKENRMASLLFREKNHLPITDSNEQQLKEEFEKREDKNQTLDDWAKSKREEYRSVYRKAAEAADASFISSFDLMGESKIFLTQQLTQEIDGQKAKGTYRLDATGEQRHEHQEKYARDGKYKDAMVEEDVDNLINNILADNEMQADGLDLSSLDEQMMTWVKGYALFARFREQPSADRSMKRNGIERMIQNCNDLMKADPARTEEMEKEIKSLRDQELQARIEQKLSESMGLKIKNRAPAMYEYWTAQRKLEAIAKARTVLEKETQGRYTDSMISVLKQRETAQMGMVEDGKDQFMRPMNSELKIKIPFTAVQDTMMSTLADYLDQITALRKEGTNEATEEALKLVAKAREMVLDYRDEEFDQQIKVTEKVMREEQLKEQKLQEAKMKTEHAGQEPDGQEPNMKQKKE